MTIDGPSAHAAKQSMLVYVEYCEKHAKETDAATWKLPQLPPLYVMNWLHGHWC